jgi:hypothetical protein
MAYAFYDDTIGMVGPTVGNVDLTGPGPGPTSTGTTFGRMVAYNMELRAYDPALGAATLMYLKYSGTIAAGTVCEITPSLASGVVIQSATAWAGTASTGRSLCVALFAGVAGQWGWFVVQGNAVATCQGAPVAGSICYWQAAGVVSPTLVAGKGVAGAVFATAPAVTIGTGTSAVVLSATQAVININRPSVEINT